MNLDEGQRQKVAEWIEQGLKLAEIQNKLAADLGITMTYMDVRFLIDDLKLRPNDILRAAHVAPAPAVSGPAPASTAGGAFSAADPAGTPAVGGVSVSVDTVARPGAIVSGRVTFSDGQGGAWLIDQTGRPGLVTDQQGYRPSPADVTEFQTKLQEELGRMGF